MDNHSQSATPDDLVTKGQVREEYGLTEGQLALLGEPDLVKTTPHYRTAGAPMQLFSRARVEQCTVENFAESERAVTLGGSPADATAPGTSSSAVATVAEQITPTSEDQPRLRGLLSACNDRAARTSRPHLSAHDLTRVLRTRCTLEGGEPEVDGVILHLKRGEQRIISLLATHAEYDQYCSLMARYEPKTAEFHLLRGQHARHYSACLTGKPIPPVSPHTALSRWKSFNDYVAAYIEKTMGARIARQYREAPRSPRLVIWRSDLAVAAARGSHIWAGLPCPEITWQVHYFPADVGLDAHGWRLDWLKDIPFSQAVLPYAVLIMTQTECDGRRRLSIRPHLSATLSDPRTDETIQYIGDPIHPSYAPWLALCGFLDQEFVVLEDAHASRQVRHAYAKKRRPLPEIKSVNLRRKAGGDRHEHRGAREWSCSWLVNGHWRRQWYASMGEHRPKYIRPFVKGNLAKPLRVAATVYRSQR